jgi:glycosyltransferase involved in cell wall biosynthesis
MREGNRCMANGHWASAIQAYAQGMIAHPSLSSHYAFNLERAQERWLEERRCINKQGADNVRVVLAAGELSHNAAGRAFTLALLYQQLGHSVTLVGSHFQPWGDTLWEPIRGAVNAAKLPVHTFAVNDHPAFFRQAWELVLQCPADLVHLSKPRLPTVVFGLLYKLFWGSTVLMDIDDEELCFVKEAEPLALDSIRRELVQLPAPDQLMGPLWTALAVDLGQRFDGITVANTALQQRYGGTVILHARDPHQLQPLRAPERLTVRRRHAIAEKASVVLFFGTARRHKGLLEVAAAVAALPEDLSPLFVVAGAIPNAKLQRELEAVLPQQRLRILGNQPFERAREILGLADLVILLSSGEVAAFQSPAKLTDALAMGLPILVSDAPPLQETSELGWTQLVDVDRLVDQIESWLRDPGARDAQARRAREGFLQSYTLQVVADHLRTCSEAAAASAAMLDEKCLDLFNHLAGWRGTSMQNHS